MVGEAVAHPTPEPAQALQLPAWICVCQRVGWAVVRNGSYL